MEFKITVLRDDDIEAFGAYAIDSLNEGEAIILLNVEANLSVSMDKDNEVSFKEMMIETLMHEFGHALEEKFDLEFNEDRVESIIESFREKSQIIKRDIIAI